MKCIKNLIQKREIKYADKKKSNQGTYENEISNELKWFHIMIGHFVFEFLIIFEFFFIRIIATTLR